MPIARRSLAASLGGALLSLALPGPGSVRAEEACQAPDPGPTPWPDIVISTRLVDAEMERCQRVGSCTQDMLTLFGMTGVLGYAVDRANRDVAVFGTSAKAAAPLRLDDWIVALRNTMEKYVQRRQIPGRGTVLVYEDPGVTIDPDPKVLTQLDQILAGAASGPALERRLQSWSSTCELPQSVNLLGLGEDAQSHFGYVLYFADLLMKSVTNGTAAVDGLDSLAASRLRLAIATAMGEDDRSAGAKLNRFWFLSGPTAYQEDDTTAVLARADVQLRTEAEQLTGDTITGTGRADPLAERYACAFSRLYPRLAADTRYAVYAELEALFRWTALGRIMVGGGAFEAAGYRPDFLLDRFIVPRVTVPATVKGVAHVSRRDHVEEDGQTRKRVTLRLPSCGGVTIGMARNEMTVIPDTGRRLPRLCASVIDARPTPRALWWKLPA